MNDFLHLIHLAMRYVHIGLGFAGLALFWVVIAMPKGTARHVAVGKAFVWIAWIVGGTALVACLWSFAHLPSFAPWLEKLSPGKRAEVTEILRFFYGLLAVLSCGTITGATFGVQVVRLRDQHQRLRRSATLVCEIVTGLSGLALIGFGVARLLFGPPSGANALPLAAYQVPVFLGGVVVFATWTELRFILQPPKGARAWQYMHVEQMFGTGIAFHTAFAVFGASRLIGYELPGAWRLLPWVLPPAIGIALTKWYVTRLKLKLGDLPAPATPTAPTLVG